MAGLSKDNPLRNAFNPGNVAKLAEDLAQTYPPFDKGGFLNMVLEGFDVLQFGERSTRIADALDQFLPRDFALAVEVLLKSLGPGLMPEQMAQLDDFIIMPQCTYVSRHCKSNVALALRAYRELTMRMSAEGDLRYVIEADYDLTMRTLHNWCSDKNSHVRRLVSEGTRPRLPLAGRIRRFQADPRPVIELLDKLVADESLYVRRSVANNINDIAKDNPDLAMEALRRWSKIGRPEVDWVVAHAARSLLKDGNKAALELMGFGGGTEIELTALPLSSSKIAIGTKAFFEARITSTSNKDQNLLVDYVINLRKANNQLKPKVFKHRKIVLKAGETVGISIGHKFIDTSGRTHYPGPQSLELQINGQRQGLWDFELI